jgi:hypothetical protein
VVFVLFRLESQLLKVGCLKDSELHRLGSIENLERGLKTTNCMESSMAFFGQKPLRWITGSMVIRGKDDLPRLCWPENPGKTTSMAMGTYSDFRTMSIFYVTYYPKSNWPN